MSLNQNSDTNARLSVIESKMQYAEEMRLEMRTENSTNFIEIKNELKDLNKYIIEAKVRDRQKSAMFGFMGGLIPTILIALWYKFTHHA